MRRTITLDEDLADRLADFARDSKIPLKVAANAALRRGLMDIAPPEPAFRLEAHAGGLHPGIDDRKLNEMAFED